MSLPPIAAASCRGPGFCSTGASRARCRPSPRLESARRVAPASRRCSVAPRGRRNRSDPRLPRGPPGRLLADTRRRCRSTGSRVPVFFSSRRCSMCANIARKRFGHEQGRSGITNPSRPGHGGGCRSATTRRSGSLSMKCTRASHRSMVATRAEAEEGPPKTPAQEIGMVFPDFDFPFSILSPDLSSACSEGGRV